MSIYTCQSLINVSILNLVEVTCTFLCIALYILYNYIQIEAACYYCDESGVCHMSGAVLTVPLSCDQSCEQKVQALLSYQPELKWTSNIRNTWLVYIIEIVLFTNRSFLAFVLSNMQSWNFIKIMLFSLSAQLSSTRQFHNGYVRQFMLYTPLYKQQSALRIQFTRKITSKNVYWQWSISFT